MDRTEFDKVLEKHYRKNYKQLVKNHTYYCNNKHTAEEVVQEAYCKALEYWETCVEFDLWFHKILWNCLRDKQHEEMMHGAVVSGYQPDSIARDGGQLNTMRLNDIMNAIYRFGVFDTTKDDHQYILRLLFVHGYDYVDVSKLVKLNITGIRKVVQRFRNTLREQVI